MFKKNVGGVDRIIRLIVGAALGYGAYTASGPAVYLLAVASAAALITGLVGYCGLYALLGIKTCRID